MESSNPVFNKELVDKIAENEKTGKMTIPGTMGKTTLLLAMLLIAAGASWRMTALNPDIALPLTLIGGLFAFVLAMIIIFTKPNPFLISLYAIAEGFILGSISYLFNGEMQGIVGQAILLTLSIFVSMLILYSTRIINVTQKVRSGIILATFGVVIFMLISLVISLFSTSYAVAINSGTTGLVIAGIIVFIAALNLLLDFDFIERGSNQGLPKSMEWFGAFGLMITLIWLYISILRFLAIARD